MTNRPALHLLLAGCLMFGAGIFVELAPGGEDAALPEAAPRANLAPAVHRQQSPRVDELLATALARPLFTSTRRPKHSAIDDGAAENDLSDKRLTGIITAPGHHIAIFAVKNEKPLILAEGETVSGWRIDIIAPIEVSLSGPAGNKILRPKPDPNLLQPPGTVLAETGAHPPAAPPGPLLPRPPRVGPPR
jgi:hypothetical protein